MSSFLLSTKTYLPQPSPDLVRRDRLLEPLNTAFLKQQRFILVSAMAGSGKSTLLADWAAQLPAAACWLALDEQDNDPAIFWAYGIAALQHVHPGFAARLQSDLLGPQPPAISAVLPELLNLLNELPGNTVLILDDYHLIQNINIHENLAYLVEHLPQNCLVVVSTRSDPLLPISRWRVRGLLAELRADDLRFRPEEASAFMNQFMGLSLDESDISLLETRTEGWAAGLQLAGLSMRGKQDQKAFIARFSASHQFILDYLTSEVITQQLVEIQAFLTQTSILSQFTAELCNAVTGSSNSEEILERLRHSNLFLIPLDDERHWYRYHHLFAEMLKVRLARQAPEGLLGFHHRAAEWYDQASMVDQALYHALAAKDVDYAADIVNRNWRRMTDIGRLKTAHGWLAKLPEDVVKGHPLLSAAMCWVLWLMGQTTGVPPYAEAALRSLAAWQTAGKVPANDYEYSTIPTQMAALRSFIAVRAECLEEAAQFAHEAIQSSLDEESQALGLAYTALSIALRELGDIEEAIDACRKAIPALLKTGNLLTVAGTIYSQGRLMMVQGRLHEAEELFSASLREFSQLIQTPAYGVLEIGLATLKYEFNDVAKAEALTASAVEKSRQGGYLDLVKNVAILRARMRRADQDFRGAIEILQEALESVQHGGTPTALAEVQAVLALSRAENGDLDQAARWSQSVPLPVVKNPGLGAGTQYFSLARVYLILDQAEKALTLCQNLEMAARAGESVGRQTEALLLEALAFARLKKPDAARQALVGALKLAAPVGYLRLFIDEGEPLRQLLQAAYPTIADHTLRHYANRILAGFLPEPPSSPQKVSQKIAEPLSEREIEVLQLISQGLTNADIARRMVVSAATVKSHIYHIYAKLDVQNRVEAVNRAKELGVL